MPPCPRVKECSCLNLECKNRQRCCDCVANHKTNDHSPLPHCLRENAARVQERLEKERAESE